MSAIAEGILGAEALKEPMTVETGERLIGTVKSFTDHWGFVRTDEGKDYFFNERSIETYGGELPAVGSRVYFSTAPDNQKPATFILTPSSNLFFLTSYF